MHFSKALIISFAALAVAVPNPAPVAEESALEARTFWWKPQPPQCNCQCPDGNSGYKRDVSPNLEGRTFWWWHQPNQNCDDVCKPQCENYWNGQKDKCYKDAQDKYNRNNNNCPKYKRNNNDNGKSCRDKCQNDWNNDKDRCNKKYSH